jgi:hypothetical protein
MRDEKELPKPELPPKEYFEDSDWLFSNLTELTRLYPDKWIGVVDKKVVAVGRDIGEVEEQVKRISERKEYPIFFVEGRIYIYADCPPVLNKD